MVTVAPRYRPKLCAHERDEAVAEFSAAHREVAMFKAEHEQVMAAGSLLSNGWQCMGPGGAAERGIGR
jgi:hypothetical protein